MTRRVTTMTIPRRRALHAGAVGRDRRQLPDPRERDDLISSSRYALMIGEGELEQLPIGGNITTWAVLRRVLSAGAGTETVGSNRGHTTTFAEHSWFGPSHTDGRSCAESGPAMRRLPEAAPGPKAAVNGWVAGLSGSGEQAHTPTTRGGGHAASEPDHHSWSACRASHGGAVGGDQPCHGEPAGGLEAIPSARLVDGHRAN
jgi:hypothetical protein